MALPASGQISMDDIRVELGVPTQSPFGLNEARSGTYVALNQNSPTLPPSSGQVSLSDWYSYNQNAGPSYNYYNVTRYDCFPCAFNESSLVARTTSPTTLTNNYYYNNGDGYVYLVASSAAGPSYTIDLDDSAGNASCSTACSL